MVARASKTRDKMKRGGLPAPFAVKPRRVRGVGDACSGCGDPIAWTETEVHVDVRGVLTLTFHEGCYRAWLTFPDGEL